MSICVRAIRARSSPQTTLSANESAPELSKMTVKELTALCEERGLDVPTRAKKADLVVLLEASHG